MVRRWMTRHRDLVGMFGVAAALAGLLAVGSQTPMAPLVGVAGLLAVVAIVTATFLGVLVGAMVAIASAQAFVRSRDRRSERIGHESSHEV